MGLKHDVFISYSRKDYLDENQNVIKNNPISRIKEVLDKESIDYWFDETGIYSGQNFTEQIVSNIESSSVFVFLSSANANDSKWTCKEIASADEYGKPIIPVRLDHTPYNKKVLFRIADLDYIEFYSNPEKGVQDLVNSIKKHLQQQEEKERAKEEEENRKLESERKEQQRLVAEINADCSALNSEELKIEAERSALISKAERILDEKEKERLKSYVINSSPIRNKREETISLLRNRVAELEKENEKLAKERDELSGKNGVHEKKHSEPNNSDVTPSFDAEALKKMPKWNWGAFLLSFIWGAFNCVPKSNRLLILCVIVFGVVLSCFSSGILYLILAIYLGIKGNELSWKYKFWQDFDTFQAAQRKWTKAAVLVAVLVSVGLIASLIIFYL